MPELAVFYFIGLLFAFATTLLFVWLIARRARTIEFARLQANLRKRSLYFSESQDRIIEWQPKAAQNDQANVCKTALLTGSLLSLLSWLGFVFLILVMISYRVLARSRLERRLLSSDLANKDDLTGTQVDEALRQLTT